MARTTLPLSPGSPPSDPNGMLQMIALNTTELVRWMKILVGAVILLVVVEVLLYV